MRWICTLLISVFLAAPATKPSTKPPKKATSAPTSAPTTAPTTGHATDTLDHGIVGFNPPANWVLRAKGNDDLSAHYRSRDGQAAMSLVVIVQPAPLPDEVGEKIATALAKKIEDEAKASDSEILTPPKIEKDERFFVKVHDRTKKDGRTDDRLQIYRREGNLLLTIVSQAYVASADDALKYHMQAEEMLLGATVAGVGEKNPPADDKSIAIKKASGDAPGPTILPKARIKIETPPPGWKSQKVDNPSGIVCTYRELGGENAMIIVSVRPLPPEAKNDPKLRDVVVDEMIPGEQTSLKIPHSKETQPPKKVDDKRFVRKTVRKYDVDGDGYTLISRQIVVGNSLVSVGSLAPDTQADKIEKLADDVAISAKLIGK